MKKLRLLLFENCNRSCEGCCNKQWNLFDLPIVKSFANYDLIMLTGGEPMLKPELILSTIIKIKQENKKAKIILYTAKTDDAVILSIILTVLDGITVTLHDQGDILKFAKLLRFLDSNPNKSLRLNIFKGVVITKYLIESEWKIKSDIEWIGSCPLPIDEVFMRLS